MKRIIGFVLVVLLLGWDMSPASRGLSYKSLFVNDFEKEGRLWVFVIGIDRYRHWVPLKTAESDAKGVRDVLLSRYGAGRETLVELYNEEATRRNIIARFRSLASEVTERDSLLIFYAGHGHVDSITRQGSWIPVDGGLSDTSAWISNGHIKNYLRTDVIRASHILMISDSCFSGELLRGGRTARLNGDYEAAVRAFQIRSRQIMTSGGLEPVKDGGFENHSVFSYFLIKALRENRSRFLVASDLFASIRSGVADNARQLPWFGSVGGTGGGQGGELVLFLAPGSEKNVSCSESRVPFTSDARQGPAAAAGNSGAREHGLQQDPDNTGNGDRYGLEIPTRMEGPHGMRFVYIKPGSFMMGSPKGEPGHQEDERAHKVILTKGFYMMTTEVTQGQWYDVMGTRPWVSEIYVRNDRACPAVNISWYDCREFVDRLNRVEGRTTYRLPTEAEWEYACRGGSSFSFCFGDTPGLLEAFAWFRGVTWKRGELFAHPVASKSPNAFGLYDMHGNVWEWCRDWYGEYPFVEVMDPVGPPSGKGRVCRGSSWGGKAVNCRSADRAWNSPSNREFHLGFRIVMAAPGEPGGAKSHR